MNIPDCLGLLIPSRVNHQDLELTSSSTLLNIMGDEVGLPNAIIHTFISFSSITFCIYFVTLFSRCTLWIDQSSW
jgi:hypothetical protein